MRIPDDGGVEPKQQCGKKRRPHTEKRAGFQEVESVARDTDLRSVRDAFGFRWSWFPKLKQPPCTKHGPEVRVTGRAFSRTAFNIGQRLRSITPAQPIMHQQKHRKRAHPFTIGVEIKHRLIELIGRSPSHRRMPASRICLYVGLGPFSPSFDDQQSQRRIVQRNLSPRRLEFPPLTPEFRDHHVIDLQMSQLIRARSPLNRIV